MCAALYSTLVLSSCSAPEGAADATESIAALPTALWFDATVKFLGPTAEWANSVELADLDGDGDVDLLFANGGNYSVQGTPEPNRVFFNNGPGERFEEQTTRVFGPTPDISRVIKARDLDGDGLIDIFVGTTYQTQSRLYLGTGAGAFVERTATPYCPIFKPTPCSASEGRQDARAR